MLLHVDCHCIVSCLTLVFQLLGLKSLLVVHFILFRVSLISQSTVEVRYYLHFLDEILIVIWDVFNDVETASIFKVSDTVEQTVADHYGVVIEVHSSSVGVQQVTDSKFRIETVVAHPNFWSLIIERLFLTLFFCDVFMSDKSSGRGCSLRGLLILCSSHHGQVICAGSRTDELINV